MIYDMWPFSKKCKHPFNSMRIHHIRSEFNGLETEEIFTILAECTLCNRIDHRVHSQLTHRAFNKVMRDKVDEVLRNDHLS